MRIWLLVAPTLNQAGKKTPIYIYSLKNLSSGLYKLQFKFTFKIDLEHDDHCLQKKEDKLLALPGAELT